MGLQGGKYGLKETLRHNFSNNVITVPLHRDVLDIAHAYQRAESAVVIDMTVSLHKFAPHDFQTMLERFVDQILRALAHSACVICVIDDPGHKPVAKVACDSSRDRQRERGIEEQRRLAEQLYDATGDELVRIPLGDDYCEQQLRAATSCSAYVNDRALRPRLMDILLTCMIDEIASEMVRLDMMYLLVVDSLDSPKRAAGAIRNPTIVASEWVQYPLNTDSLGKGEGDMKAESHDRFIRGLIGNPASPLLKYIRVIVHVTVDTDAIAIFLASTATRARMANSYESVVDEHCQSMVALEATVGPRGNQRVERMVCAPGNMYNSITSSMGIDANAVDAEVVIASLITLWALAGCDFCEYRYGRVSEMTTALSEYILKNGTGPLATILDYSTAKSASGALMAVWRRAAEGCLAMGTNGAGKRMRVAVPPPTDAQICNALWAGLYWRNNPPPETEVGEWHFHTDTVSSETPAPQEVCIASA